MFELRDSGLRFCCVLDKGALLPRQAAWAAGLEASRPWLFRGGGGGADPDWLVLRARLSPEAMASVRERYGLARFVRVYPYLTQRPELISHLFRPKSPAQGEGVALYRLRAP